jgi:hypothetical protein
LNGIKYKNIINNIYLTKREERKKEEEGEEGKDY